MKNVKGTKVYGCKVSLSFFLEINLLPSWKSECPFLQTLDSTIGYPPDVCRVCVNKMVCRCTLVSISLIINEVGPHFNA